MKIALIGYGKMGMAIEEIALQRGHEIVLKSTSIILKTIQLKTYRKPMLRLNLPVRKALLKM